MSPDQDQYNYSGQSPVYYSPGPSPTVTQHSHSPGPSWIHSATSASDGQGGYTQSHQDTGLINAEEMNNTFNHPQTTYPPQDTSFQDHSAQPGPAYDHGFPLDLSTFQFYGYPTADYRHSYPPYGSTHGFPGQYSANHVFQMDDLTQTLSRYESPDIYAPQIPHGPPAPDYRTSSLTQLPLMERGGLAPVYGGNSGSGRPIVEISKLGGVNTANAELLNAGAGQHSHTSPVAASPSSQIPVAGPSRPPPGSPERKRLLPLSADEDHSTARNVVPRSERAWSVPSTSSDSHRRNRRADVPGRGPLIPQERYTTSSVSSFSTTHITFNLENPNLTGIPIVDILNKTGTFNRIQDRTQAFNHMGKKTFTLRVQWPGYKPWCKTIAALNWRKSRGPITRVKLAEDIATAVRDLLQKKRDERYDPDYAEWNIGPDGIQLEQLCLVALHHVSKGSWQPQFCLLQPRQH